MLIVGRADSGRVSSGIPKPGAVFSLAEGRLHTFKVRRDDDFELKQRRDRAQTESHLRDLDDAPLRLRGSNDERPDVQERPTTE
jgi:hypothetical protein